MQLPQGTLETIENAITEVAKGEFRALCTNRKTRETVKSIDRGLRIFDDLSKGRKPDYDDPFTVINYAAWYQPMQIMLAYLAFKRLVKLSKRERVITNKPVLHVVDFGCGQLAASIGLAMVLADNLRHNRHITSINVALCDESRKMYEFGKKTWITWQKHIEQHPNLDALGDACSLFQFNFQKSTKPLSKPRSSETWLIAMHVLYNDTQNNQLIRRTLNSIFRDVKPSAGFLTFHDNHHARRFANLVSPFVESKFDRYEVSDLMDPPYPPLRELGRYWRYIDQFADQLENTNSIRNAPPRWGRSQSDAAAQFYTPRIG